MKIAYLLYLSILFIYWIIELKLEKDFNRWLILY